LTGDEMVRQSDKLTALSKAEGQAHHIEKIILFLIIGIFVVHALSLNFTQDDAYISYRYVRNLINGHGLVFNPGERVEGYTNFLWIIILSIFARLGVDMIMVSKILGVASGAMALFLIYQISLDFFGKKEWFFRLFAPLLLASNSAFAYWSISGLETAFFVMTVLLSVYFYFTKQRLMIISSALSTLIRPEGVLVFAILILHKFFFSAKGESIGKKDNLKNCLSYIAGFIVLLLPFLIFKIFYYGNLLPNPFYAKTGFSLEYLKAGGAYFWLFLKHYGLWGALYLIPIVFYKDLEVKGKLAFLMTFIYTLYVVIIGGDVLKAHRFFLPVLPFLYLLFSFALRKLYLTSKKQAIPIFAVISFSVLTFLLPRNWIKNVRSAEISLSVKMSLYAQKLRKSFGTDFTLAMSTIGAISYLTDARVIDMLGLTDPYIAKHPEKIPGIFSTWKEKKFNTQYLLSRNPDVIMFSTGLKPSAPAERALFLSSKFRENYYPYYFPERVLLVVYKRKGEYLKKNEIFPDARFVNLYNEAINLQNTGNLSACLDRLKEILEVGPKDFAKIYESLGHCNLLMGNKKEGKKYAQKAIEMDDYCTLAHMMLYVIYLEEGDTTAATQEEDRVRLHNPEMLELKLQIDQSNKSRIR
jgi:arabinofuranosyltransferase